MFAHGCSACAPECRIGHCSYRNAQCRSCLLDTGCGVSSSTDRLAGNCYTQVLLAACLSAWIHSVLMFPHRLVNQSSVFL
jgi:hypothetical protein